MDRRRSPIKDNLALDLDDEELNELIPEKFNIQHLILPITPPDPLPNEPLQQAGVLEQALIAALIINQEGEVIQEVGNFQEQDIVEPPVVIDVMPHQLDQQLENQYFEPVEQGQGRGQVRGRGVGRGRPRGRARGGVRGAGRGRGQGRGFLHPVLLPLVPLQPLLPPEPLPQAEIVEQVVIEDQDIAEPPVVIDVIPHQLDQQLEDQYFQPVEQGQGRGQVRGRGRPRGRARGAGRGRGQGRGFLHPILLPAGPLPHLAPPEPLPQEEIVEQAVIEDQDIAEPPVVIDVMPHQLCQQLEDQDNIQGEGVIANDNFPHDLDNIEWNEVMQHIHREEVVGDLVQNLYNENINQLEIRGQQLGNIRDEEIRQQLRQQIGQGQEEVQIHQPLPLPGQGIGKMEQMDEIMQNIQGEEVPADDDLNANNFVLDLDNIEWDENIQNIHREDELADDVLIAENLVLGLNNEDMNQLQQIRLQLENLREIDEMRQQMNQQIYQQIANILNRGRGRGVQPVQPVLFPAPPLLPLMPPELLLHEPLPQAIIEEEFIPEEIIFPEEYDIQEEGNLQQQDIDDNELENQDNIQGEKVPADDMIEDNFVLDLDDVEWDENIQNIGENQLFHPQQVLPEIEGIGALQDIVYGRVPSPETLEQAEPIASNTPESSPGRQYREWLEFEAFVDAIHRGTVREALSPQSTSTVSAYSTEADQPITLKEPEIPVPQPSPEPLEQEPTLWVSKRGNQSESTGTSLLIPSTSRHSQYQLEFESFLNASHRGTVRGSLRPQLTSTVSGYSTEADQPVILNDPAIPVPQPLLEDRELTPEAETEEENSESIASNTHGPGPGRPSRERSYQSEFEAFLNASHRGTVRGSRDREPTHSMGQESSIGSNVSKVPVLRTYSKLGTQPETAVPLPLQPSKRVRGTGRAPLTSTVRQTQALPQQEIVEEAYTPEEINLPEEGDIQNEINLKEQNIESEIAEPTVPIVPELRTYSKRRIQTETSVPIASTSHASQQMTSQPSKRLRVSGIQRTHPTSTTSRQTVLPSAPQSESTGTSPLIATPEAETEEQALMDLARYIEYIEQESLGVGLERQRQLLREQDFGLHLHDRQPSPEPLEQEPTVRVSKRRNQSESTGTSSLIPNASRDSQYIQTGAQPSKRRKVKGPEKDRMTTTITPIPIIPESVIIEEPVREDRETSPELQIDTSDTDTASENELSPHPEVAEQHIESLPTIPHFLKPYQLSQQLEDQDNFQVEDIQSEIAESTDPIASTSYASQQMTSQPSKRYRVSGPQRTHPTSTASRQTVLPSAPPFQPLLPLLPSSGNQFREWHLAAAQPSTSRISPPGRPPTPESEEEEEEETPTLIELYQELLDQESTEMPQQKVNPLEFAVKQIGLFEDNIEDNTQPIDDPLEADRNYLRDNTGVPGGFELGEPIGAGRFGRVFRATRNSDNSVCAIKILKPGFSMAAEDSNEYEVNHLLPFIREKRHNNIVIHRELLTSTIDRSRYIVMEYSNVGNLYNLITDAKRWREKNEINTRYMMKGISNAIVFLHSRTMSVYHGDIRPQNILLFETPDKKPSNKNIQMSRYIPKICDFSKALRRQRGRDQPKVLQSTRRSADIHYSAPEAGTTGPVSPYAVNKADVYSLGCTLLALLIGDHPFVPKKANPTLKQINLMKLDKTVGIMIGDLNLSNNLQDLLVRALSKRLDKRLSAEAFRNHHWFHLQ